MTEIEKEMIAIIYYRDCWEQHRINLKNFIFDLAYNKITINDWEIWKERMWDVKNSIRYIKYLAEQNLKEWKKLYLSLIK